MCHRARVNVVQDVTDLNDHRIVVSFQDIFVQLFLLFMSGEIKIGILSIYIQRKFRLYRKTKLKYTVKINQKPKIPASTRPEYRPALENKP